MKTKPFTIVRDRAVAIVYEKELHLILGYARLQIMSTPAKIWNENDVVAMRAIQRLLKYIPEVR